MKNQDLNDEQKLLGPAKPLNNLQIDAAPEISDRSGKKGDASQA